MNWAIAAVAILVAINGGLVGAMMMLRRMSMIADAVVHSILPGLVMAYLIQGDRSPLAMMIGALVASALSLLLIGWIRRVLQLKVDSAIGVVFTTMFALGIVLISLFANRVEIDADCVLFGQLAYVPLDLWIRPSGLNLGPIALWECGVTTVVIVSFLWIARRALLASAFDPTFHEIHGTNKVVWRVGLMFMTCLFAVTSFHAVGAVMVMAFFILPSATAYLISTTMRALIGWSMAFGILGACLGLGLAIALNLSIAGSMVCVLFALFLLISASVAKASIAH